MRIGYSKIPKICVPALSQGNLILFDLASLQGQWAVICCLPPFEFSETIVLNQFQRTFQKEEAKLVGILPFGDLPLNPHLPKTRSLRIPVLADPLHRLSRIFGFTRKLLPNRCQSYLIDPTGIIQYHLIHQLHWRGLSFLIEILNHCQERHPSSHGPSVEERSTEKPSQCVQHSYFHFHTTKTTLTLS